MQKIDKIFIGGMIVAGSIGVGGTIALDESKAKPINDVVYSVEQLQKKDAQGKYKEYTKEEVEAVIGKTEYETVVHEYVAPEGAGYQILMYRQLGTTSEFKSKGYGVEADIRTWDWKPYKNNEV